jgi:hypothetical protein
MGLTCTRILPQHGVLRDVGVNHVAENPTDRTAEHHHLPIFSTIIANLISDKNQVDTKTKMLRAVMSSRIIGGWLLAISVCNVALHQRQ